MMTNNAQSPKVGSSVMSFEEWKRKNPTLVLTLDEQKLLAAYKQYELSVGGLQLPSTINTITGILDISEEKLTTELTNNKPVSNIDLSGATDMLTRVGIATGNSTLTNVGSIAGTALNFAKGLKSLKGLQGVNKVGGVASLAGGAVDTLNSTFFGNQRANNSSLTNSINDVYDFASTAAMSLGPVGAIVGGAMKVGSFIGNGLTAMGVGTDQMTTTDQVLDSNFLKITPAGLVNAIGAKRSDNFQVDNKVRELIGGSYGGAYAFMDDAASKAGKKYGLFSGGARREANRKIGESKVMQNKITNINKEARDAQSIATSMQDLLTTNYQFNLAGGYDQRYIRAARQGDKIQRVKKINLTFRKGGLIHNLINLETKEVEWQPVILEHKVEEFKQGGSISWECDTWEPTIIEDAWEPVIIYKDGGKTEESEEEPLTNLKNVIPEGALHARKHHMEHAEELTKKGIPVIDNDGDQQAEIELNEIIFSLEVTLKLEELYRDGSDEAAIEAGKLLVQEILFNTEDRTGLIKTLKLGGTINGSTE